MLNGDSEVEDNHDNYVHNNVDRNSMDDEKRIFAEHLQMSQTSKMLDSRLDTETVPTVRKHMQTMTRGYLDFSHIEEKEKISGWLSRENSSVENEKLQRFRDQQAEKAANSSVAGVSVDDPTVDTIPKTVAFDDSIYHMKTLSVNKAAGTDADEKALQVNTDEGSDIIHPYYSEDLFVNATYPMEVEDLELPPPPPPKSPPPPQTLKSFGATAGVGAKKGKKKIGLDRDERRRSIEKKTQYL